MAYFRCGGGDGKKSLILPDNVSNTFIKAFDSKLLLLWDLPTNSEVPIEYFNIYYCKTDVQPTSLEQFTLHGTALPTDTSYEITGLDNNENYYVVVESVTTDDYENASMRGVTSGLPSDVEFVCIGISGESYSSTNGYEWEEVTGAVCSCNVNALAYGNGKYVCCGYYNSSGSNYVYYRTPYSSKWVLLFESIESKWFCKSILHHDGKFIFLFYQSNGATGSSVKYAFSIKTIDDNLEGELETLYTSGYVASDLHYDIKYYHDRYYIIGGEVRYSFDLVTWVYVKNLTTQYGSDYGNGRLVSVGANASYYCDTSNPTSWVGLNLPTSQITRYMYGVSYIEDRFVSFATNGYVHYLLDGKTTWVLGICIKVSQEFQGHAYSEKRKVLIALSRTANEPSYLTYDKGDTVEPIEQLNGGKLYAICCS